MPSSNRQNRHYLAMLLAMALIILLLFEFASFALGAYFVYNQPTSNVVALTEHSGSSTFLNLNASQLTPNSPRTIWIDPSVTYDSAGNAFILANSGFLIANVTTDNQGAIAGNYRISSSVLQQIAVDGQSVHAVWVAGIGGDHLPGSTQYMSLTSDSTQNYTSATVGRGVILFVTVLTFEVPVSFNLGELFLVLWTIYIILFAMALNGPFRSLWGSVKSAASRGIAALTGNAMFATLLIFPVVLWGTVLLALIQQAGGISSGSLPTIDPLLEFVELSIAPLREEIGFRMIPIGVAALVVLVSRGKLRDGILALWHPSRYLKKNDSPERYKRHLRLMYVMIAISSILFGLAHVLLGAGWGPGKIASAAAAGVALGALYYVYGLPSAVLLHWSIDYFLSIFTFNNTALINIGNFVTEYTIFLAAISSIVLIVLLIRKLRKSESGMAEVHWGSGVR
ncbi:MAG: CPBP family intramembrane metalloprotease [Nitrososphaerota archaeon]|nr:CPBP family intramembrane metalloprotease [Nitrososphaerota archaeon]